MGLLDINETEHSLNEMVLFKLKVKEYIRYHFFENEENPDLYHGLQPSDEMSPVSL